MSVFNLGVVFGPTLLRAAEETLAAILDIKFNNVVIEILIENYDLIFKNSPGKASEYLSHAQTSPPEPVPRTYGGYRLSRSSVNNTQPLMRVVTRVNYTDTGMSSSLQNIPNGMSTTSGSIYQNANNKVVKNHHPIYETKKSINQLNQSTPSLACDVNQLVAPTRELSIGRDSGVQSGYLTSSSPNANHMNSSESPLHRSANVSMNSGIHMDQSISPLQTSLGSNRSMSTSMNSRTPNAHDSIYAQLQSQRLNALNYSSENNLVNPVSSVLDRINSTSSSNESVCSTSSLNHSYTRQQPTQLKHLSQPPNQSQLQSVPGANQLPNYMGYNSKSNNYTIRDDTSQSYLPKKTQRTKDIARQRYNSPRDNV